MSNCLRKTEGYTPKPGGGWHSGKGDSGVLFKLEVDLGRCKRVTDSDSSWRRQGYDSVWRDTRGGKGDENCVKDPKRIKIVDAFLTHAANAQALGYFVENGRLVKKAPRTGWVMAGGELAPTEFYHGCSLESAVKIQNSGFRVDLAGANDGAMLGNGAYITSALLKAYMYADNQHHNGARRPHDGAVLKLKVDLGKCYKVTRRNDPDMATWMNRGYDSAWSPAGVNGQRGEHCVRDPSRIQVIGKCSRFLGVFFRSSKQRLHRCLPDGHREGERRGLPGSGGTCARARRG